MLVLLSRFIEADLEDIADWIAEDNPTRAVTFIAGIRAEFNRIGKGPLLDQLRPDIGVDVRIAVVGRYVILFRVDSAAVRIDRVVFGGRDLPPLAQ